MMQDEIRAYISVAFPGCDADLWLMASRKPWVVQIKSDGMSIRIEVPVNEIGMRGDVSLQFYVPHGREHEFILINRLVDRMKWYANGHNASRVRDLADRMADQAICP
jgi:hypothetical protein